MTCMILFKSLLFLGRTPLKKKKYVLSNLNSRKDEKLRGKVKEFY